MHAHVVSQGQEVRFVGCFTGPGGSNDGMRMWCVVEVGRESLQALHAALGTQNSHAAAA